MQAKYSTETLIEELVTATYGDNISAREKHAFGEALRGLVRLAKAEQMLEMRMDIKNKLSQLPYDSLPSYADHAQAGGKQKNWQ
jgi:hypothetical protein